MMRIRDLFTVPEGQKVTEKHLRRVLISSVCSILLCMSCLVGTTWAWFTVSIENTDNVIQIGTPEVRLTIGGEEHNPEESLVAADYTVKIEHANVGDAFQKKADLYVTMTIQSENGTVTVYTVLNSENNYSTQVQIQAQLAFTLNWEVSWFAPANAIELIDTTIPLVIEKPTEPSTEAPTESTGEETGESTEQPSESATEPSEEPSEPVSEPSEEPSSEPTEPSSQPTSEPTEPSSQPTEGNPPEPTGEATAEPTEDTTETTATTSATDPSDEPTEPVTESTAATGETEETTEPDQPQE